MNSPRYYGYQCLVLHLLIALLLILLTSLGWVKEYQIFSLLLFFWGINSLTHGLAMLKSTQLPWKEIPHYKIFSFGDRRSIIALISLGIFMTCFSLYTFLV